MRVSTATLLRPAEPGTDVDIDVDVVNSGTIIDGVSARLIGLDAAQVSAEPAMLPLFPDASGRITLRVALPDSQAAGVHPVTVEVRSQSTGEVHHVDSQVEVVPRPGVSLRRTPRTLRKRRAGRFVLEVENTGNVALDCELSAPPSDSGATVRLQPERLTVGAGRTVPVSALVKGPRMVTGSEMDRAVTVDLLARQQVLAGDEDQAEAVEPLTASASMVLKQRPLLSRGLMTAVVLLCILGLWAGAFLLGLTHVFAGDPVPKAAPASFFTGTDLKGDLSNVAAETPPGALPKSGLMPPGVGGEIQGTVTAVSDGQPVGRILVQAWRDSPSGPKLVSAAATQADGTYDLTGLFPTTYRLKFSADGFEPIWYPSAPSQAGAKQVTAVSQGLVTGIDAKVTGLPGSISGSVDPGDSDTPVPTTVVARLLSDTGTASVAARTVTGAGGAYSLKNLASPGTYQLSFEAPGYATTTLTQDLGGGEDRLQPAAVLSAGNGQISGTVSADGQPVGGVTVSTTVAGSSVAVITPTSGAVGAFTLGNLPTPGTYVVTFSGPDLGTTTQIVDLKAGQAAQRLDQDLATGTGSVTGVVRGPDGKMGGVTVTVGGANAPDGSAPTTTTLTDGSNVGFYSLNNLTAPGSYTLTFSADGFAPQTIPLVLDDQGGAKKIDATLVTELGSITGKVTSTDGVLLVGATVVATDGTHTFTAHNGGPGGVGAPLPTGGYLIDSVPPGWYSVTATIDGYGQVTWLDHVEAGDNAPVNLELTKGGGS